MEDVDNGSTRFNMLPLDSNDGRRRVMCMSIQESLNPPKCKGKVAKRTKNVRRKVSSVGLASRLRVFAEAMGQRREPITYAPVRNFYLSSNTQNVRPKPNTGLKHVRLDRHIGQDEHVVNTPRRDTDVKFGNTTGLGWGRRRTGLAKAEDDQSTGEHLGNECVL